MNSISQGRLALVHPELSRRIVRLAQMLAFDLEITQGLRTWTEQGDLYAQGRTQPGNIVTHAPAGYSWHNYGLAVDLVPEDVSAGQPDWNLSHPAWARMVSVAESLGLVSGAEWHGAELDSPHVQLTGRFPVTPDDEVRQLFRDGGTEAVWNEAKI